MRRVSGSAAAASAAAAPTFRISRGRGRSLPTAGCNELEPHTRCKASGFQRQFLTPYGAEIVELPKSKRIYIFDIGGPHTFRTIYIDGRSHPKNLEPTLLRPLDRLVGRRHARRRHGRLQRGLLDRPRRCAAHRRSCTPSRSSRGPIRRDALRADRRRSGRLHEAVGRDDEPAAGGGHRAVRVRLPAAELRARADGGPVQDASIARRCRCREEVRAGCERCAGRCKGCEVVRGVQEVRAVRCARVRARSALASCRVHAQNNFIYKAPTPADWAALAKLPDFSGVWEVGFGPAPAVRAPVERRPAAPARAAAWRCAAVQAGARRGGGAGAQLAAADAVAVRN